MRSLFQLDARHGRDGLRPLSTQAERFKSASSIAAVQKVGAGENSTASAEMLVSPVGRTLNPPSQPGAGDHSKSFFPAKRSHEHVIAAGIESPGPLLFIRYSRGDDQLSRPSGQIRAHRSPVSVRQPAFAKDHWKFAPVQSRESLAAVVRDFSSGSAGSITSLASSPRVMQFALRLKF